LEMRSLDVRIEHNPSSGGRKPHPEVDILEISDSRIEPLYGVESLSADRAEPGPERRCLAPGLVMNVVMQEASERGHDPVVAGGVVVRREGRSESSVQVECRSDTREGVRVDLDVRVHEDEDVRTRLAYADVPSDARMAVLGVRDDMELVVGCELRSDRVRAAR